MKPQLLAILAAAGGLAFSTRTPPAPGATPRSGGISPQLLPLPAATGPQSCRLVRYYSSTADYFVFLTETDVILVLETGVVRIHFLASNPRPVIDVEPATASGSGLFFGAPPNATQGTRAYSRVHYRGVYAGIDVDFHANGGAVEHDFIVAPGADPANIRMRFEGADQIHLDAAGALVMLVGSTEFSLSPPLAYQGLPHTRNRTAPAVDVRYVITAEGEVGFSLGAYDRLKTLTIDPVFLVGSRAP